MIMTRIAKRTKDVFLLSALLLLLMGCSDAKNKTDDNQQSLSPDLVTNPISASGNKAKSNLPLMEFDSDNHDFGLIVQGEKVAHTFKFKNSGGADLVISSASATCGCTVPAFSKEPVKPGGTGKVEVVFDSSGRQGFNTQEVKILTNAQPNTIKLTVRAEIYVPKN